MTTQQLREADQATLEAKIVEYVLVTDEGAVIKTEPWVAKLALVAAIGARVNGLFAADIEPWMFRPEYKAGRKVFYVTAPGPIIEAALEGGKFMLVTAESTSWQVKVELSTYDASAARQSLRRDDHNWGVLRVNSGITVTKDQASDLVGKALASVGPFTVEPARTTFQVDADGLATGNLTVRFKADGNVAAVDRFFTLLNIRVSDNLMVSCRPSNDFCKWWSVCKLCLKLQTKCNCSVAPYKPTGKRPISSSFNSMMKKAAMAPRSSMDDGR